MLTSLKNEIRAALANTSSQRPVDTDVLATGHRRSRVEAALMEMYQANEVCCCKLTKGSSERVVWWIGGAGAFAPITYRTLRMAA
ncbi:MAG: hypothetical protein A3J87_00205 [Sideroxydans sp. RIFOXYB12_FULL_59_6]|nr:MAG: hypothetical protein A3J87_00205 [Sideroxydans sp. RIFOXYB12_FULL_59_6]